MRSLHRCLRATFFVLLSGAALVAQQPPPAQVSQQEILDGLPSDGSKWLTFGGNYFNHRHSPLTQINPQNVNKLAPQWTFQTDTLGRFETTRSEERRVGKECSAAWARGCEIRK